MAEMRTLMAYFGQFDGTGKAWKDVEPFFDAAFAKDVEIVTVTREGQGATGYDEWAKFLKNSLERKADIQMTKLEAVEGGIEYSASLCYPDKDPIPFSSFAAFKDGKMIKISPKH